MTNEEAIEILSQLIETGGLPSSAEEFHAAISKSIDALSALIKIQTILQSEQQEETNFDRVDQEEGLEVSDELFEKLRNWRLDKKKELNRPAYSIFKDETLKELARYKPTTIEQLRKVRGVGNGKKLEQFGDELIEIITAFVTSLENTAEFVDILPINPQFDGINFPQEETDTVNADIVLHEEDYTAESADVNWIWLDQSEINAFFHNINNAFRDKINEHDLFESINVLLDTLKRAKLHQPEDFNQNMCGELEDLIRKRKAVSDFILLQEDFNSIRYQEDLNEIVSDFYELMTILEEAEVNKRLDKEIRQLIENKSDLPTRNLGQCEIERKSAIIRLDANAPECRLCGSKMVIREGGRREYFWGCSTFPKCFSSRNLTNDQMDSIPSC